MIRSSILVLALSMALNYASLGQTTGSSQQPQTAETASGAAPGKPVAVPAPARPAGDPGAVPPGQAVITLKGACEATPDGPKPAPGCVSSVTKEQFEKLTNALKPDLSADEKRNLAQNYGRLLVFADTARALGLENDPKVQEMFNFYKDQILAQAVNQHYSQEYAHPSDQQIEQYYNQNKKKYLEATLQRIIVPNKTGSTGTPSETEGKAYVEQLREKWVAGGDPAKLQAEAMEHAGVKQAGPDVNVGARRPGTLPVQHESVFQLKAGEVSQAYNDPSASYLYKVVSIREIPLAEVKDSIGRQLSQQMIKDKMESIASSVTPELNETYFGPPPQMSPPGAATRPQGAAAPPAPAQQQNQAPPK